MEKDTLRPLQANTHRKIADCYSNRNASSGEVERCAQNCQVPLMNIQNLIQNEMNQFQEKLTRCTMVCQDQVADKFDFAGNTSDRNTAAAEKMLMGCVNECVDKHIALLRSVSAKMEKDIANIVRSQN